MKYEELQKAKALEAAINSIQNNIDKYELLLSENEIIIMAYVGKIKERLKTALEGLYYSDNLPAPLYFTGNKKELILNTLINEATILRDERQKELDAM